jgi:membrane protein insertase Oxa1/YidC/SpoIIIJ
MKSESARDRRFRSTNFWLALPGPVELGRVHVAGRGSSIGAAGRPWLRTAVCGPHSLQLPLDLLKLSRSIIFPFLNVSELIPLNSKFLWMDLGLPERTLLLGFSIPILALIVGLTTFVQTKLTMPPAADPNDQAAQTSKMMGIYMPVMLFFFSLNYASGLAVYFITSNLLAIAQYAMMGKVNWRNLLPGGQKK